MDYKTDYNKLIIDDEVIYEAPAKIDEIILNPINAEAVLVMYDGFRLLPDDYHDITNPKIKDPKLQEAINQNVLCIDKNGNIIWRIESTFDYPIDHTHFFSEGGLWVYRRDAREFMIDPANGKILAQRLGL